MRLNLTCGSAPIFVDTRYKRVYSCHATWRTVFIQPYLSTVIFSTFLAGLSVPSIFFPFSVILVLIFYANKYIPHVSLRFVLQNWKLHCETGILMSCIYLSQDEIHFNRRNVREKLLNVLPMRNQCWRCWIETNVVIN